MGTFTMVKQLEAKTTKWPKTEVKNDWGAGGLVRRARESREGKGREVKKG